MVFKRLLILSLLAAPLAAGAQQNAGEYFHRGSQFYIFGEDQKAGNEIGTGLRLFPEDASLQALAGLLKKKKEEQQQQQNQQDQNQNKDDQQKKQDSEKSQNQKQDSSGQQQKNEDSKPSEPKDQQQQSRPNQPPEKKDQPKPDPQQARNQAEPGKKPENSDEKPESGQTYAAGQMTPQQARRLLDGQKDDEMMLPVQPDKNPPAPSSIKDW